MIRSITWVAIIANWVLILSLARQLRRAHRRNDELFQDAMHYATMAGMAAATLHSVAPETPIPVPEETARWIEARHLEYMVYGDE